MWRLGKLATYSDILELFFLFQPAPVEVVKAPIPEKDAVLKETLDTLVQKCLHASNNPVSIYTPV